MQTKKPSVSNRSQYRLGVSQLLTYMVSQPGRTQPELSLPETFNTYQFL